MPGVFDSEEYVCSTDMLFWIMKKFTDIPIVNVNVDTLKKHMNIKYWEFPGTIKPNDVIQNPQQYPDHIKRIKKCDLRYPIFMNKNGTKIYDGLHRLTRSVMDKRKIIKVQYIPDIVIKLSILGTESQKDIHKKSIPQLKSLFKSRIWLINRIVEQTAKGSRPMPLISFPKSEHKSIIDDLDRNGIVYTHRVCNEYDKYKIKYIYYHSVFGYLMVVVSCDYADIRDSPLFDHQTPANKKILLRYHHNGAQLLTLKKMKWY